VLVATGAFQRGVGYSVRIARGGDASCLEYQQVLNSAAGVDDDAAHSA
jgi:hypothetical protein